MRDTTPPSAGKSAGVNPAGRNGPNDSQDAPKDNPRPRWERCSGRSCQQKGHRKYSVVMFPCDRRGDGKCKASDEEVDDIGRPASSIEHCKSQEDQRSCNRSEVDDGIVWWK